MGQFSWLAVDTNEQIFNDGTKDQNITMVYKDKQGEIKSVQESNYEGYGVFGGLDFYEVLAWMNNLPIVDTGDKENDTDYNRDLGIDLYFKKGTPCLMPQLFENPVRDIQSVDFRNPVEDDPNQGWGQSEDEDDNDEFSDEESEW